MRTLITEERNHSIYIRVEGRKSVLEVEDTSATSFIVSEILSLNPLYQQWLRKGMLAPNLPPRNGNPFETTYLDMCLQLDSWFISEEHVERDKYLVEFKSTIKRLLSQLMVLRNHIFI
jgi:hypothetical protein